MKSVISIIIPVFNSEKYLMACMESVLKQTYQKLQIIVIDDGSKDNSLKILNDYAKIDKRILVIHQENKGVSAARNLGIKYVTGDWIIFVDSDDKIVPDYCWKMMNAAIKLEAEIVIANTSSEKGMLFTNEQKEKLICSCLAFDEMTFAFNIDAPWGKIFCAELIKKNNIVFPENLKRSEDAYFCMDSYYWANKIGYINCSGYQYLVRDNSLSKKYSIDAKDTLEKILEVNYNWVQMRGENNLKFKKALWLRVLPGIVESEKYYFLHEYYKENENYMNKEYKDFLKQPMVNRAIQELKLKDVKKKQYKVRLLFYKMNLATVFFRIKKKSCTRYPSSS